MDWVEATPPEVVLTRGESIAERIERLIGESRSSIDAAMYRLTSRRLARALQEASARGVRVRLVLDRNKYDEAQVTREILADERLPFRLAYGRQGRGSKMHHKFALLDGSIALTGSYNWTVESEEDNYENLLILREPKLIEVYRREFEALWANASEL
jgi:phosphatidylserine/phosphatidylglycerophosphate/cardiolipin synthase-like enzyme